MGETADALAHYSVVASKGSLLLADIQGMFLRSSTDMLILATLVVAIKAPFTKNTDDIVNGEIWYLFDPMTH